MAVTDKLHKQEYESSIPVMEECIEQHGKIGLLVDRHDFHGWGTAEFWEDIKFDVKLYSHFLRITMVGEKNGLDLISGFEELSEKQETPQQTNQL